MREHRETVLLVEDDPSVNQAVGRLLEAAGFHVRSFGSGEEVLADPTHKAANCLVVDIHLPGISGFELVRRLKANGMSASAVLMTAHDDPMHRLAADDSGASAYLIKPFSRCALIDAVIAAIASQPTP